jgi:hypothetical protein
MPRQQDSKVFLLLFLQKKAKCSFFEKKEPKTLLLPALCGKETTL